MADIYNRKDLVVDVDKRLMPGRYTHKEIDEIICATLTAIATAVGEGQHVSIHGFGAWQAVERRERVGRSLYGERVEIPQRRRVKFKASPKFEDVAKNGSGALEGRSITARRTARRAT